MFALPSKRQVFLLKSQIHLKTMKKSFLTVNTTYKSSTAVQIYTDIHIESTYEMNLPDHKKNRHNFVEIFINYKFYVNP